MLVANSFDLWQKDTFFSAAEEVQQSADIMESAYRTWHRARREGLIPQHLDELERELRMALGTAKWQLEEFEKAVRSSYKSKGDDVTAARHKQFVSCMEDQITRAKTALKESFDTDGKKPFRWVNLDEEECHDLACFLSGTPGTSPQTMQDGNVNHGSLITSSCMKNDNSRDSYSLGSEVTSKTQVSNAGNCLEVTVDDANLYCDLEERESREEVYQVTSNHRTWNSPDRSTLEIVIDRGDMQRNALIESTPKEKGIKPFSWRSLIEHHPEAKGGVLNFIQLRITNWMNQNLRGSPRSQRQHQVTAVLPVQSIRFILVLMLTIFLVVPFLVFSN